jgi:hypothetical protein
VPALRVSNSEPLSGADCVAEVTPCPSVAYLVSALQSGFVGFALNWHRHAGALEACDSRAGKASLRHRDGTDKASTPLSNELGPARYPMNSDRQRVAGAEMMGAAAMLSWKFKIILFSLMISVILTAVVTLLAVGLF